MKKAIEPEEGSTTGRHGLRPCYITTKNRHIRGYFHCWEQRSEIVYPSPLVGGHPGGVLAGCLGIVEDEHGKVYEVEPTEIRFTDVKEER